MRVLRMGVNEVDQCGKIRCHAPILSGDVFTQPRATADFFPTRPGDHIVSASASKQTCERRRLMSTFGGLWLPVPVSSVAFAALHDAFGVLTPICGE